MQCREITRQFIELLDGTIAENDRRRSVEAHLARCQECQEQFTALQKTLDLVEYADMVASPGEQFWVNYLPEVRSRMMERRRMRYSIPVWVGGTAVVLLALFFGSQGVHRAITPSRYITGQATAIVETTSTRQAVGGDTGGVTAARVAGRGDIEAQGRASTVVRRGVTVKRSSNILPDVLDDPMTTELSGRDEETGLTDEELHEMETTLEAYQIEYGDLDRLIDDLSVEEWEEFYEKVRGTTNS